MVCMHEMHIWYAGMSLILHMHAWNQLQIVKNLSDYQRNCLKLSSHFWGIQAWSIAPLGEALKRSAMSPYPLACPSLHHTASKAMKLFKVIVLFNELLFFHYRRTKTRADHICLLNVSALYVCVQTAQNRGQANKYTRRHRLIYRLVYERVEG